MDNLLAKHLIQTYYGNFASLLDLDSIKEVKFGDYVAEKLKIAHYQIYQINYDGRKGEYAVFLFVYLEEPDEIIAHKLMNFTNEIAWFYSNSDEVSALPSIIPILLYNGVQEWTPKNLKQIYTSTDFMPEFHFDFLDLKRSTAKTI